jgi:hypothetical protein
VLPVAQRTLGGGGALWIGGREVVQLARIGARVEAEQLLVAAVAREDPGLVAVAQRQRGAAAPLHGGPGAARGTRLARAQER